MRRVLPFPLLAALVAAAPAAAQTPPPDTVAPVLSAPSVTPKVARAGVGVTLRFTLSEAAVVGGAIARRSRGVRTRGGRCLPRRAGRRGARCTRRTPAGTFTAPNAAAGANSAKLRLQGLRIGTYTLTLTPTDAAGNPGAPRALAFRVDL